MALDMTMPRALTRADVYVFGCPICHKEYRSDEPGEPCCTGPSETRDEHVLEVMHLLRVESTRYEGNINPVKAGERAAGKLIMPDDPDFKY